MNNHPGYSMIENDDRISAITDSGVEICGAFSPIGHEYWSLFVTRLVSEATGLTIPPHREHFWGRQGNVVARAWVELIACLYVKATQVAVAA